MLGILYISLSTIKFIKLLRSLVKGIPKRMPKDVRIAYSKFIISDTSPTERPITRKVAYSLLRSDKEIVVVLKIIAKATNVPKT